jgi:hypothetical protein
MGNSRQAGPVPPAYRSQWPPRQTQGYRGISKRGNPRLRSFRFIGRPTLVLHAHRRHVPAQYVRSVCVGVSAMAEPRAMPELLLLRLCRHELVAEAANDHGAPIAIGKGHGDGDHAPLRIVTPRRLPSRSGSTHGRECPAGECAKADRKSPGDTATASSGRRPLVASCGGAPLSIISAYVRSHRKEGALPPRPQGRGFRAHD